MSMRILSNTIKTNYNNEINFLLRLCFKAKMKASGCSEAKIQADSVGAGKLS